MTVPTSVGIDLAFLPIWALVTLAALACLIRAGRGNFGGLIQLNIFAIIRLASDIILVYAYYSKTTSVGVYIAGYLLQGLGYSFLLTSALTLYGRTITPTAAPSGEGRSAKRVRQLPRLLSTVSLVALILLIVGFNTYDGFKNPSTDGSPLPTTAKAGDVLFIIATLGLAVLVVPRLQSASSASEDKATRALLLGITAALPFFLVRTVYATVLAFSSHPLQGNAWARFVGINLCELAGVLALLAATFVAGPATKRVASNNDVEQADTHLGDTDEHHNPAFTYTQGHGGQHATPPGSGVEEKASYRS